MAKTEGWDGRLGARQWAPIVGILSLAVAALAVLLVLNLGDDGNDNPQPSTGGGRAPTHEHADFALFIRGEQFNFNQPRFISSAEGDVQSGDVHIHDFRYSVVHVHTTLTTWDQFFTSLGFTLTDPSFPGIDDSRTCLTMPDGDKLCNTATEKWKFVVNEVPVDGISNVNIGDLSRVLISYGPESVEQVMQTQWPKVSDEACIVDELCLDRVDVNEPPEECGGRGQCSK